MKRPERCTACGSLDIVVIVDGDDDYIECSACGSRFDEVAVLVPRMLSIEARQNAEWRQMTRDLCAHIDRLFRGHFGGHRA